MVETPDLKYRSFVTHRALDLARDYVFEALALAVVILTQSDIWMNVDENRIRVVGDRALHGRCAALPRGAAPFVVPLAVASGALAFTLLDATAAYETDSMFLVLILAAWAAGSLLDDRQALIALGALLVAGWTVFIRAPDVPATELIWLSIPVVGTFVLSAATARHSERARLAEQRMLEAEEVARRAVDGGAEPDHARAPRRGRALGQRHDRPGERRAAAAHTRAGARARGADDGRGDRSPGARRDAPAARDHADGGRGRRARAAAGARHAARARRAGAPVGPAGRAHGRGRLPSRSRPASTSPRTASSRRR